MRRSARVVVLIVLAVGLACGEEPRIEVSEPDLLYFQGPRGVSVLAAGAAEADAPTNGVPSTDWSSVVTTDSSRLATHVEAHDARSGQTLWKQSVDGPKVDVRVVSQEAQMVALTPARQYHYTQGRTKTSIVVTGRDQSPRTIELDGNYEPEAFSTDGNSLFLLEYLPPQAPDSYRVRRLDLGTDEVLGVYSVDAELQERMRGTARVQAISPGGTYLYTLYTTGGGRFGPRRAFVHVLNLDELWAHCIDLPEEFGRMRESAIALTVRPDAKRLYVNDVDSGAMAEVDTQSLEVLNTSGSVAMPSGTGPRGVHDGDHTLYVARGPSLTAVDTRVLDEVNTWSMPAKIRGVQVSADGSKVYVALTRNVVTLDAATGRELGITNPPGVERIHRMGPVMRSIQEPLPKIACAC